MSVQYESNFGIGFTVTVSNDEMLSDFDDDIFGCIEYVIRSRSDLRVLDFQKRFGCGIEYAIVYDKTFKEIAISANEHEDNLLEFCKEHELTVLGEFGLVGGLLIY